MKRRTISSMALVALCSLFLLWNAAFAQTKATTSAGKSAETQTAKPAGEKPATSQAAKPAGGKLDLNSATKEQLMELPGIGDALSQKIIANRPYRSKDELVTKKVIPEATYKKISPMIIAKQK